METVTSTTETKTRPDVNELVTNKIIEQLNNGIVPWQKPWIETGPPTNLVTRKPYSGINALLLGMEEYEQNVFLSFDQVNGIGGKVKRGSKGSAVVHWIKKKEGGQGEATQEKAEWDLRYYTVFNIAQCEKVPETYLQVPLAAPAHLGGDIIVTSMPNCPHIQNKEPNVFYDVVGDIVHLPKKKGAKKDADYYAQLFRQLIHATGHDTRLARKGMVEMTENATQPLFSREDMIAEIGTCFLLSQAGISPVFKNGPGYIAGWAARLAGDKFLIINAAKEAQKAVNYILNVKAESKESVQSEG